jgi:transcriptional regulator with XRE-family HTH domain
MKKNKKSTEAIEILHNRYIGENPERKISIQEERVNAEVARTIYELRREAGLTQQQLADFVGTTQSVISRLEDADYEGHSLAMLSRIAKTLNQRLRVLVTPKDPEVETIRFVFREVIRRLRKSRGFTQEEFAKKLDLDKDEVFAMEHNSDYKPDPLTLFKLSKFYGIPQRKLAELAGAVARVPGEMQVQASRFAAQSDSFSKLTPEEKRILDEFVTFLKKEV